MAGLMAAKVLSTRFDRVTVVERDALPAGPDIRRGVPQARHAHALLAGGQRALSAQFPDVAAELAEAGAVTINAAEKATWFQGGGRRVRYRSRVDLVCASRALLESVVRRHVASTAGVTVLDGTTVKGLHASSDRCRIVGARVERDGVSTDLAADLVVDATGRAAPLLGDLVALGYELPATDHIHVDIRYATQVIDRRPGDLDGAEFLIALAEPPRSRYAVVLPLEGDRWILTTSGAHGDHPPVTPEGLASFVASFDLPELVSLADPSRSTAPARTHRFPSSQRRLLEKLRAVPTGYVLLGDAVCSFNPVYGQGMTSAFLQAEALGRTIDRVGTTGDRLPRSFYRAAAKVVADPWRIAAGADFNLPETTGAKPFGTDVLNRYVARVVRACQTSPAVAEQMVLVQNLLTPATSLMRPDVMLRVLAATRRRSTTSTPRRDVEHLAGGGSGDPVRTYVDR
jgi:2-polyprenyl-6-methoxyphenol hydroxylase-like FAD-dependent oxidoreductase